MKPLMMFFSYLFNFLWKKLAHLGPVSKSCIFILVLLLVFQLAVPKIRSKALAGVFSVSVQEQKTNFKPGTNVFLYHNTAADFTHYHDIYLTKAP